MKVLVITERFFPEDFLVNDLVKAWKDLGDDVEVLTQVPSYPMDKIYDGYENKRMQTTCEFHGISVHRVSTIFGYNKSVKLKVLNYIHFALRTFFWALLHGRKYDKVFVYHTAALTMATSVIALKKIWRKEVSIWTQDLWPDAVWGFGFKKTKFREFLLNSFVRRIYSCCDRIMVSCRQFIPRIKEICGRDAQFVPQWDTMDDSSVEKILTAKGTSSGNVNFMFAGNLGKPQNLLNVLNGFAKASLEDATLHFVGAGVMLEELKLAAKDIANIVFHGRKKREDMPVWYQMADVLIISLTKEYKLTLPGKFQSYIRTGKPIVGVLLGDAREMIEEFNLGFTSDPDDIEGIAEAFAKAAKVVRDTSLLGYQKRAVELSKKMFDREKLIAALR